MYTHTDPRSAGKKKRVSHYHNDHGGYTIEAAIVLPLFVLAVMTIAFVIRVIGIEGSVMQIAADEAGRLAIDSYSVRSGILFEPALKARIYEECEDAVRCDTKGYQYLTVRGDKDGIILCTLKTEARLPVPFPLAKPPSFQTTVMARAWIGKRSAGTPMPFEEMEEESDSVTVWVFPARGERYHKESCLFVSNEPREFVLTDRLRRNYAPCPICDSAELSNGSLVYCYPAYGESYHRGSCSQVDRYVVPMELEDAQSRGYTPCSKCGGQ
ncbi:MAG: pilus assembly protein [Firmicutes bacterium]|nr:pilus assembly protein [Bacillota bacterium]